MNKLINIFDGKIGISLPSIMSALAMIFIFSFVCLNLTGLLGIVDKYVTRNFSANAFMCVILYLVFIFGFGAYIVGNSIRTRYRLIFPYDEIEPEDTEYIMPQWPTISDDFMLVVGEKHGLKKGYSVNPDWFVLPARGLFAGTIVFGSPGSSKTAGIALPYLRQFLEYYPGDVNKKSAGLLMDYKASLVQPLMELAAEYNRKEDILLIGPEHDVFWNPIHCPDLEPRVISSRVMAILENISGEQSDSGKWIRDATALLLEHCIGVIRLSFGYVTLFDVSRLIADITSDIGAWEEMSKGKGSMKDLLDDFFDPMLEKVLPADVRQFRHHAAWFHQYAREKPQIRSHYVMEAGRILQYFTDPRHRLKYCPPLDKINFFGFRDSCIRDGRIVALDATVEKYGPLANALGIFLKLEFQKNLLSRKSDHLATGLNYDRPVFLFIDEYQEFVSAAGNFGDDQFLALSRESKAVNVFLTQGRVSLVSKLGDVRTKVLLNSIRTKIFLGLEDPDDRAFAATTSGQEWRMKESISVGEQVESARLTSTGDFVGDKTTVNESRSLQQDNLNRWEPTDFRDLPAFTAIVSAFDGTRMLYPERVYLKPYFKNRTVTHQEFMSTWGH
jgi:hypothetical protein